MKDILTKLGGRKFLLSLLAGAVAVTLEFKVQGGLTTTMAALLGGLPAAFGVSNVIATQAYEKARAIKAAASKTGGDGKLAAETNERVAALQEQISAVIEDSQTNGQEITRTLLEIGTAVQNTQKLLQAAMQAKKT